MVRDAAAALGFEPRVVLDGPIDSTVPADIADELVATLREALSNVARHAQATAVDVEVTVGADVLVRVVDDGVGLPGDERPEGHGLRNMAERAARLGGTFATTGAPRGGTIVTWRVPLADVVSGAARPITALSADGEGAGIADPKRRAASSCVDDQRTLGARHGEARCVDPEAEAAEAAADATGRGTGREPGLQARVEDAAAGAGAAGRRASASHSRTPRSRCAGALLLGAARGARPARPEGVRRPADDDEVVRIEPRAARR